MKARIITIGDEILIGQIIDRNSAYIGNELVNLGIDVKEIISISDNKEAIITALKESNNMVDLVIITGGLGPTKDDITKDVFCDYFETRLVPNQNALDNIIKLFRNRNIEINDLNRKQADLPENCTVLPNLTGTASGMLFAKDDTIYISLPGVPFEMKHLMESQVIPYLKSKFKLPVIVQRTVHLQGAYESLLAQTLEEWENNCNLNGLSIAYLPSPGIIRIRITGRGEDRKRITKKINSAIENLYPLIPGKIFGFDGQTLQEVIVQMLLEKNEKLSVAESCTGGNIGHLITSVPGASMCFEGGIISYSNKAKINQLSVLPETIDKYGAVSREVVEEMAMGVMRKMNTDYAIAVSGIAGPGGGTEDKPVGTTWIAVADKKKVIAQSFLFGDHRGRNITKSSNTALNMLKKVILGESW